MKTALLPTCTDFLSAPGTCRWGERPVVAIPAAVEVDPALFPEFQLQPEAELPVLDEPEHYRLHLTAVGPAIEGAAAGVRHGLRSLRQLCRDGGPIPTGTIEDGPAIPWRGYHLDCKGGFPGLEGLYAFTQRLIDLKYNCLLLEYEDQFPYPSFPGVARAEAPGLAEWAAYLDWLRRQGVQPIPLVQTAGHLEYVLRHPAWSHLAEDGKVNELCLSHPDSLPLARRLLDDVLALHEPDDFVHLGADETWYLATCPRCRERLAAGRAKLDLYCDHVGALAEAVLSLGKRPLIWADMFWRGEDPGQVVRLPRQTILCEWVYNGTRAGAPGCYWQGRYTWSDAYAARHPGEVPAGRTVSALPPPARAFLEQWWPLDEATGLGPISPYVPFFRRLGYTVWGVGAARAGQGGDRAGIALAPRLENLHLWARDAAQWELPGLIWSSWSRSSTLRPLYGPWESALLPLAAGAQLAWRPDTAPTALLHGTARWLFGADLGAELSALVAAFDATATSRDGHALAATQAALTALRAGARRGGDYLDLLALAAAFNSWRGGAEQHLTNLEGVLCRIPRGMLPPEGRGNRRECLDGCAHLARQMDEWAGRLEQGLGPWFSAGDRAEYIETRLGDLRFRLANVTAALRGDSP